KIKNQLCMNVVDRIMEILNDTGLSARQFELSIEKTSGYLNSLKTRGSSPSVDVVSKIVEVYPHYSAEWILSGRGAMYIGSGKEKLKKEGASIDCDTTIDEIIDSKIQSRMNDLKATLIQMIINEIDKEISDTKQSISNRMSD